MDLDFGLGVLECSGNCFLLHVEVSEGLLPLLDLVEDSFNVVSWIRHLGLDQDKNLEIIDHLL